MFVRTKTGRNTFTIAIVTASILGSTSVLAGRATGLPHYRDSAPATTSRPDAVPLSSRLSSAERIARLEDEILALKTCLMSVVEHRTFRCAM